MDSANAVLPDLDRLDVAELKMLLQEQHEQLVAKDAQILSITLLIEAPQVGDPQVAPPAVRTAQRKTRAADRAVGAVGRRARSRGCATRHRFSRANAINAGAGHPQGTARVSRTSAARNANHYAPFGVLPRLRRHAQASGRRRLRNARTGAGALQSDSPRAAEAGLRELRYDRASVGAGTPDRARHGRPGPAGPRAGQQVCRPCAALPASGDLRA